MPRRTTNRLVICGRHAERVDGADPLTERPTPACWRSAAARYHPAKPDRRAGRPGVRDPPLATAASTPKLAALEPGGVKVGFGL
jgi:hypothetical protein